MNCHIISARSEDRGERNTYVALATVREHAHVRGPGTPARGVLYCTVFTNCACNELGTASVNMRGPITSRISDQIGLPRPYHQLYHWHRTGTGTGAGTGAGTGTVPVPVPDR